MMYLEMSIGQYFRVGNITLWGKVNIYMKGKLNLFHKKKKLATELFAFEEKFRKQKKSIKCRFYFLFLPRLHL